MRKCFLLILIMLFISIGFGTYLNNSNLPYTLTLNYETGFMSIIFHTIQFGENGTNFDYVKSGGQNILFPFNRYSLSVNGGKHTVYLLYQPLTVQTRTLLSEELVLDETVFFANSAVILNYGFPFYRVSYTYDILNGESGFLAVGASLQIRNANIYFEAIDGSEYYENRDLGPVPILKVKGEWWFSRKGYLGLDIDGFYASSKFFNGSNFDFEGSILDASLRAGIKLNDSINGYLNVRFLGGTASGVEQDTDRPDGFTDNKLATVNFTVGFELK